MLAGDPHAGWSESFNELFAQVAGAFANVAVRRHGRAYLLGLLSQTERKNGWTLAEFAADVSPDGLQRLLNFSPWDEDACRDAVRRYVVLHLGDPGAVLVVDDRSPTGGRTLSSTGRKRSTSCPPGPSMSC
jgi:SRSO17 transposase